MNPQITIKGNLAADPEIRELSSTKVSKFRIITSDSYKDDKDEWQSRDTSGWTIEAWGTLAEKAYNTLKKGDSVIVVGTIKERSFEAADGTKRYVYETKASGIGLDLPNKPAHSVLNSGDDLWQDLSGARE